MSAEPTISTKKVTNDQFAFFYSAIFHGAMPTANALMQLYRRKS